MEAAPEPPAGSVAQQEQQQQQQQQLRKPGPGQRWSRAQDAPHKRDGSIQGKLDFEIRMQKGICKLLSLSTQKDQLLHAVKNLMVCNARIMAYTEQLEKLREQTGPERRCVDSEKERTACKGKVALSDIRIPLMWKDSDHFSNKEGSQRYAIFCLFKTGTEIFDTNMMIVDKTITDLCFENVTIFNEARPDFQIKVEVYSCCVEEASLANAPRTLAKRLRRSLSKTTAKKISCMLQDDHETDFDFIPAKGGVKYSLLAHTTLTLENTDESFRTHTLTITGNEESSFWLPLYGNMCCRLVAQPACMAEDAFKGFLNQQLTVEGLIIWTRFYSVLRGGQLFCYYSPEEIEAKFEPTLVVPFNKETRIRAMNKDPKKKAHRFFVINITDDKAITETFAADSLEELQEWMDAFRQHIFDLSQWKHCCEELMKIEIMSPRKPPLFLTKEATSVYHDMSIDSPVKLESLTDIIKKKIEDTHGQFLIEKESSSRWGAFFDGSHQIVLQKKVVLSPANDYLNTNDGKGKKRRALLPPSDKPPCSMKGPATSDQLDKENKENKTDFDSPASSLDPSLT
ncbi:rhotekin-2 [Sarcophilus harrisii]|uniref:rhotekin-2 n=1 Tax=Sarcophilus harrisii TaxID=9305 RepID=UPI001301AD17|nr:rhotekin-2 [Sarcophilus harrisii]